MATKPSWKDHENEPESGSKTPLRMQERRHGDQVTHEALMGWCQRAGSKHGKNGYRASGYSKDAGGKYPKYLLIAAPSAVRASRLLPGPNEMSWLRWVSVQQQRLEKGSWGRDDGDISSHDLLLRSCHEKKREWNAAAAMLEALPCHGDADAPARWHKHVEESLHPEYEAKRIAWLASRLQTQGYNTADAASVQRKRASSSSSTSESLPSTDATSGESEASVARDALDKVEDISGDHPSQRHPWADQLQDKPWEEEDEDEEAARLARRRRRRRSNLKHLPASVQDLGVHADSGLVADSSPQLGGSKMGLLAGWLVGRVGAGVAFFLSSRITRASGSPYETKLAEARSAPVHWLVACLAAAWLGSLAVHRLGAHPAWQIGCVAAWLFTLVG